MSSSARWWRFCMVGAIGAAVQLGTLALSKCCFGSHYVVASIVALEVTLTHNFVWHQRFTWRERFERGGVLRRWWRFQAANGAVSLLGSLLLVPAWVHWLHAPVVVANAAAIPCCAVLNFSLGERWAFRDSTGSEKARAVALISPGVAASLRASSPWFRGKKAAR